ncbi:hypothetical protein [Streptomyces sp. NPDC096032]|uniref:hypothetical protein n=1 Tax=Streptomyces sp. NPDC096032 TaxID=3366070 RepID=UPI00382CBC7B
MAEGDTGGGGQPDPQGGESTPAHGSDDGARVDPPSQDPDADTTPDDTPADTRGQPPTWAQLGRTLGAVITVLAALGGLVLGVRAEQRADREEQRAVEAESQLLQEKRKSFAEQVDFYRTSSAVVVMNGNPHMVDVRLSLPAKKLWWELGGLTPCSQISIPNTSLRGSMRTRMPSAHVTDADLPSLMLEFTDPQNRVWIRGSGGSLGLPRRQPVMHGPGVVDLNETWSRSRQDAPMCGAP